MQMKNNSEQILTFLEKLSFLILIFHVIMWFVLTGGFAESWLSLMVDQLKNFKLTESTIEYTGIGLNPNWLSVVITILTIVMFTLRVVIIYLINRFLKQITTHTIFSETNLRFIRLINYSFMGIIFLDIISTIIYNVVQSAGGAISNGHGLGLEVLAWFAVYVICIVLEYGLQIQRDNNAII